MWSLWMKFLYYPHSADTPGEQETFAQLTEEVRRTSKLAPAANLLIVAFIPALVPAKFFTIPVLTWLCSLLFVTLLRSFAINKLLVTSASKLSVEERASWLILLSTGTGLLWGTLPFVMNWNMNDPSETLILIALAGLAAGGMAAQSPIFISSTLFVSSILLPAVIYYAFSGATQPIVMGLIVFVFAAFLIKTSHQLHLSMRKRVQAELALSKLNFELQGARKAAETASRAKSEFLANMSHEIRTPLAGVMGMTELAHSRAEDPELKDYLATAQKSAEALLGVVNDILDFSRIEAGKLKIESTEFSLSEELARLERLFDSLAQAKDITFKLEIDAETPANLIGDPLRIGQVISNLLSNAIKFTPNGGDVTLRVLTTQVENSRVQIRFEIEDNGIGMPEEKQQLIFEALSQADVSITRKYGGTGLGLTISRHLVSLMGGDLKFQSEETEGTVFWFSLPLVKVGKQRAPDRKQHETATRRPAQPLSILVAEDNPVNQRVIVRILEDEGHSVTLVANGRLAVEAASSSAFDIILMDCQMPEMDGYEASRTLRRAACDTPIVAVTAHALSGEREKCIASGMDDYLTKPIDRRELLSRIARATEDGAHTSS